MKDVLAAGLARSTKFGPFLLMAVLSGCATQLNGRYQPINISTSEDPSECTIDDMTFSAPAIVTVKRKREQIVTCKNPTGKTATVRLNAGVSAAWAGNVFYGLIPGYLFDVATGGIHTLPERVVLNYSDPPGLVISPKRRKPAAADDWKRQGAMAP